MRIGWPVWAAALGIAAVAGVTFTILHQNAAPAAVEYQAAPAITSAATWAAGRREAPEFHLTDQHGSPISVARFRGRPVLVTFIDPLCRNFCPLEAKVLMRAVKQFPPGERPAVIAVSVNPPGDTAADFALDAKHWGLNANWYWAAGSESKLTSVWKRYNIGVQTVTKTVAGVKVVDVVHTEGAYVLDSKGYERALYLYPYKATDVEKTIRSLD